MHSGLSTTSLCNVHGSIYNFIVLVDSLYNPTHSINSVLGSVRSAFDSVCSILVSVWFRV